MASLSYRTDRQTWRVKDTKREPDGSRTEMSRTFRTKSEAKAFMAVASDNNWAPRRPRTTTAERLGRQTVVDIEAGCWLWTGRINNRGYGLTSQTRPGAPATASAHRVSYETFVGPIPEGLQIDHLCNVPICINPEHLEPVTEPENHRRKWARIRRATAVAS